MLSSQSPYDLEILSSGLLNPGTQNGPKFKLRTFLQVFTLTDCSCFFLHPMPMWVCYKRLFLKWPLYFFAYFLVSCFCLMRLGSFQACDLRDVLLHGTNHVTSVLHHWQFHLNPFESSKEHPQQRGWIAAIAESYLIYFHFIFQLCSLLYKKNWMQHFELIFLLTYFSLLSFLAPSTTAKNYLLPKASSLNKMSTFQKLVSFNISK